MACSPDQEEKFNHPIEGNETETTLEHLEIQPRDISSSEQSECSDQMTDVNTLHRTHTQVIKAEDIFDLETRTHVIQQIKPITEYYIDTHLNIHSDPLLVDTQ